MQTGAVGERLAELLPDGRLRDVLSGAEDGTDQIVLTGDHHRGVLLAGQGKWISNSNAFPDCGTTPQPFRAPTGPTEVPTMRLAGKRLLDRRLSPTSAPSRRRCGTQGGSAGLVVGARAAAAELAVL
jgi:hypothetical protein